MKNRPKELLPFILLFILFNNFFLLSKSWLARHSLDYQVLIIANSLFFVLHLLTYLMQKRALKNSNPNVFVRSVMAGMMIKMAVCAIAALVYIVVFKSSVSKMSVFAAMFLYFMYLAVEVRLATRLNKQNNV